MTEGIKDFRLADGTVAPHVFDGYMWRALGCLPPKPDFGGLPKFSAHNEVIPRSEWRDIDFSGFNAPILNQGQHNSCTGHGAVTAFWRTWLIQNYTPHDFSACFIYAQRGGLGDGGMVISDALDVIESRGVGLLSDVPEGQIWQQNIPAQAYETAKRFRGKGYHCQSFDEIVSAFQCGRMVVYGIYVAGDFGNLDREGVAPAHSSRYGNHCMTGRGVKKLPSGRWAIDNQNSWGIRWGNNGTCLLTEDHFKNEYIDAFAIEVDLSDPQEVFV